MMAFKKKTFRYYYWFFVEYTKKHIRLILLSFLLSFFIIVSLISFSPFLQAFLSARQNVIGRVGKYSYNNLPEEITSKISHGLVFVNEKGEILPALASKWEVKNEGREYRFYLKKDLFWNDNKPFTARTISYDFKDVEVKPVNAQTIDFKLKKPLPIFPIYLAQPIIKYPLTGVIGLYTVDKIRSRYGVITELSLRPNKKDIPHLTYRFYDTESKLINAYKRGEIREMEITKKTLVDQFQNWKNTTIIKKVDYTQVLTLFFNLDSGALSDKDVRKAIHLAMPTDELKDFGELADSPIPPTSWAYNPNLKNILEDTATADKTLRKSFEASGSANLNFITFYEYLDVGTLINDNLKKVGVKTNLRLNPFDRGSNFDMLLAFLRLPQDPDQYFFWHSTQEQGNISHYKNVRIDKLLEDGRSTLSVSRRREFYHDFQKVIVDDTPAIFLYYPYTYTIRRK